MLRPKTLEELDDELCNYCEPTQRGTSKCYGTPYGYYSCEGAYCEEAYETYLEEYEDDDNGVEVEEGENNG